MRNIGGVLPQAVIGIELRYIGRSLMGFLAGILALAVAAVIEIKGNLTGLFGFMVFSTVFIAAFSLLCFGGSLLRRRRTRDSAFGPSAFRSEPSYARVLMATFYSVLQFVMLSVVVLNAPLEKRPPSIAIIVGCAFAALYGAVTAFAEWRKFLQSQLIQAF